MQSIRPGRRPTTPRSAVVVASCVLPALAGCREAEPAGGPPRPHVVMVCIDTLRADFLGCYGFEGDVSPGLDRLANESVLFENCTAHAPWTKPSIASLFTGLHPESHGLTVHPEFPHTAAGPENEGRTGVLPGEAVTLAERMRDAGYVTAAFVANPWLAPEHGFAQGFDVFDDHAAGNGIPAFFVLDAARIWLASMPPEQPVFLYLHFMDVHAPYDAPQEDFAALESSPSVLPAGELTEAQAAHRRWQNIDRRSPWVTDEMRLREEYWRTRYASGIRELDRDLTRFLDWMRARGTLDESWLVVTSDHGEELYEHGNWSHGLTLYEHQLRVPLIVRPPGGRPARRVDDIVQMVDIMPTLLDVTGAERVGVAQGRSLAAYLSDSRAAPTGPADGMAFAGATFANPSLVSARTRTHKLIVDRSSGAMQLYDLAADPKEQTDLAGEQRELAATLAKRLDQHFEATLATVLSSESAELSDEQMDRLEALGYFGNE